MILVFLLLTLPRLGESVLWLDEAIFYVLGCNTLQFGQPVASDGRNLVSMFQATTLDEHDRWAHHPAFFFHVLAGVFRVFPATAFFARLPSVVCGVVTIVATALAAATAPGGRLAARLAVAILVLSVQFLLISRDCTFYTPGIALTAVCLLTYLRLGESDPRFWAPAFVASGTALFYSTFVYAPPVLVATGLHAVRTHTQRSLRLGALTLIGLACMPTVISRVRQGWVHGVRSHYAGYLCHNYWRITVHLFPFVAIAGIVALVALVGRNVRATAVRRPRPVRSADRVRGEGLSLVLILLVCGPVVTTLLLPPHLSRYILWALPAAAVGGAAMLSTLWRFHPSIGAAVTAGVLFTNCFALLPYAVVDRTVGWTPLTRRLVKAPMSVTTRSASYRMMSQEEFLASHCRLRSFPVEHAGQLVRGYSGPMDRLVDFLIRDDARGTLCFCGLPYVPVMAHTRLRVINPMRWSDGIQPYRTPNAEQVRRLRERHGVAMDTVDHFVFYGEPWEGDASARQAAFVSTNRDQYELSTIDVPDLLFNNSVDLYEHCFDEGDVARRRVRIYRKRAAGTSGRSESSRSAPLSLAAGAEDVRRPPPQGRSKDKTCK